MPYHTDLSPAAVLNHLVPTSRTIRHIPIPVPISPEEVRANKRASVDGMTIEAEDTAKVVELTTGTAPVNSDGMLLYVAQATYEPGTSPLSLWVPLHAYVDKKADGHDGEMAMEVGSDDSPLGLFEKYVSPYPPGAIRLSCYRLIRLRLLRGSNIHEADMES